MLRPNSLATKIALSICLCLALFGLPHMAFPSKKTISPELKMREYMVDISKQLGVVCTHCHDTNNYKSDSMKAYKIAKNHIQLVNEINKSEKDLLGVKANCYMCHKGKVTPDYKQK